LDNVAARVAELLGMDIDQVWQPGKFRPQVQARSLLCYWAVRELGESMTAMDHAAWHLNAGGKQIGGPGN
jgi:putative transposase